MDDPGLAEVQAEGRGFLAGNLWYWLIPKSSPDFAIFTNINYTHCDKICLCVSMGFNWYMMYVYILHWFGFQYSSTEPWEEAAVLAEVSTFFGAKEPSIAESIPPGRLSSGTFSSRKAICLLNFTHLFHFAGKDCSAKTCKTCECWSRKRDFWVYMNSWGGSVWSFFLAVTSQDHLMKCPSCHL